MRILLDTGPLVALLNKRDSHHSWSVEQAGKLKPPFHTCEAVLAEAHFLLQDVRNGNRNLIQLLRTGRIVLPTHPSSFLDRVGELMTTYSNIPMSFADACLVYMAEQKKGIVFTLDSDFHIYRKNQKDALDLLIP